MAVYGSEETDATRRQIYDSLLAWCDQLGMTEQAARMRAAGPPPPQEGDSDSGWATHQKHRTTSAGPRSAQVEEPRDERPRTKRSSQHAGRTGGQI